jgi:hypothetical protein
MTVEWHRCAGEFQTEELPIIEPKESPVAAHLRVALAV